MAKIKNTVSKVGSVTDGPRIDFATIERDVDEDGCVDPLEEIDAGLGIETRYARLVASRSTALFCAFVGDYEDCHVEIRIPWDILENILETQRLCMNAEAILGKIPEATR